MRFLLPLLMILVGAVAADAQTTTTEPATPPVPMAPTEPAVPVVPTEPTVAPTAPADPVVPMTPAPETPAPPAVEVDDANDADDVTDRPIVGTIRVPDEADIHSMTTIGAEQASAIAAAAHPDAEIDDIELEVVNGYLFFEVELENDAKKLEMELLIDAGTGKIVRSEVTDDD